ncbi:hypothetical protein NO1_1976, partial [Candidatus Termititenax aidoneus]
MAAIAGIVLCKYSPWKLDWGIFIAELNKFKSL